MSKSTGEGSLQVTDTRTGREYSIPIAKGSVLATDFQQITNKSSDSGEIRSLRILDQGFRNTAPICSDISNLDPNRGVLQYRQYLIEDLFLSCGFEDCTYLLVWGKLPSDDERAWLASRLAAQMVLPAQVAAVINAFDVEAPIMPIIMAGLSAWAALDPMLIPVLAEKNLYDELQLVEDCIPRTFSALAVVVAFSYCHAKNTKFTPAEPHLSYVENLMLMMGFVKANGRPDPLQVREVSTMLTLHAEHGMCNATAAFLHCASTRADPLSCLISALAAIYGPLHGGSNIITYKHLQLISQNDDFTQLMEDVVQGRRRIFGFGHRIYRVIDPRAKLLRALIQRFKRDGRPEPPLLHIAERLDHEVSANPYFVQRGINANTDLYTVLAYQTMGIPEELVFPLICISRTQGFLAHWREFITQKSPNWRPQQIFTGTDAVSGTASKL